MKIAVASDHAGYRLKNSIIKFLNGLGHKVEDFGCFSEDSCDYVDFGYQAALSVFRKKNKMAVLICGSGVGMSIVANKVRGIRAALCMDEQIARLSRNHNDANVICIGARFTNTAKAKSLVNIFLKTPFAGGRHKRRVAKISDVEKQCGAKL